jgi:hypothetical protein
MLSYLIIFVSSFILLVGCLSRCIFTNKGLKACNCVGRSVLKGHTYLLCFRLTLMVYNYKYVDSSFRPVLVRLFHTANNHSTILHYASAYISIWTSFLATKEICYQLLQAWCWVTACERISIIPWRRLKSKSWWGDCPAGTPLKPSAHNNLEKQNELHIRIPGSVKRRAEPSAAQQPAPVPGICLEDTTRPKSASSPKSQ